MTRRWRPSLGLVLGGALAGTLALSLGGLVVFRYLGPEIGYREAAVLLGSLIAAVTAVVGWLLVRLLLRPIRALETYAMAEGTAEVPRHYGTRETHATAQRVIAMAEALRDRETTVRAYTDHVTHEMKTPVSAIRAAVELMQDTAALSDEEHRLLARIDTARLQIETRLAALRRAAQAREVRYLGSTTLDRLAPDLTAAHPALRLDLDGRHTALPMGREGVAVVLDQLLNNAVEHGATRVTVTATQAAGKTTLDVQDNGSGISEGNAARIFDPFFTTRRDRGGTGMGLAVAANILAAHRGSIVYIPSPTGARFRVAWTTH
ncbi:sensor histidine kinase [Sagittula stellata]|uniref:histidine kinase n=1 Tax=Sagittula stellata (strain ATCC 700073 / DSM 11524 / E-37) TaxID=388399 RepID=A3K0W1_SAGS3|nr:HAMP domain-containing sensor histidine kinase [Sagittula stellata]EBA09426.1 two-component sensor histidine kinase [Sagittula stellata E-37]